MEESIMGKARDTWLKQECVNAADSVFGLYNMVEALRTGYAELRQPLKDIINARIQELITRGQLSPDDASDINHHILNNDFFKASNYIKNKAFEKIVECQCGKQVSSPTCATCAIREICEIRDLVEAGLAICDEQENRPVTKPSS